MKIQIFLVQKFYITILIRDINLSIYSKEISEFCIITKFRNEVSKEN